MSKIVDIIVTKETVSDDSYKVTSILYENAALIKKGDIIGSFETSKTDIDVESPMDGYVFYNCKAESTIIVGSVFASIAETKSLPEYYFGNKTTGNKGGVTAEKKVGTPGDLRISKPAERLIRENKIDMAVFKGKNIVEKKDVEEYLDKNRTGPGGNEKNAWDSFGNSKTNKVIILGGGNHSKVCVDIIRQMHGFEISGIVYTKSKPAADLMGCPILGGVDELENIYRNTATNAVIGIGGLDNPEERTLLFTRLKLIGYNIPNIIHPRSIIEPSVVIGEGTQVMGGANIGSCTIIGNNCIINSNSVVSHDCWIGDNVHITPGAIVAGAVKVGNNSIIGMGVTVYYNCTIGKHVVINNGHHIFKNVPDNSIIR